MDKSHILEAIKRIAGESDGKAPGRNVFERETGVRMHDWYPHLWLRWGDALREAGFEANKLQTSISNDVVIQKYVDFARELNHLPVEGEIRRRARMDKAFPSHSVFGRFGGRGGLIREVLRYCEETPGNDDIVTLCENRKVNAKHSSDSSLTAKVRVSTGFIYLMKSGRHYKIGHTKYIGSRERQLAIQIPIPPTTIHTIETDDPLGVEAYWHKRFDEKRGEGEWFDLSADDIRAFKRWKRIV